MVYAWYMEFVYGSLTLEGRHDVQNYFSKVMFALSDEFMLVGYFNQRESLSQKLEGSLHVRG